jgi:hypothetical protein
VSVLVAGVAAALSGPLAVAQAAAGWDPEVLAAHGCRVSPRTGLPSLSEALNALPWEDAPVAAATSEVSRDHIEARTVRVLPASARNKPAARLAD